MSRALKRSVAKKFKKASESKYTSLKNINLSEFMKKVNSSNVHEQMPLEDICKYTVLMKTLQYIVVVNEKIIREDFNRINDLFVSVFGRMKDSPMYLAYAGALIQSEDRVDIILNSIDSRFNIKEFMEEDKDIAKTIFKDSISSFLYASIRYFIAGLYENDIFLKDLKKTLTDDDRDKVEEIESLLSEVDEYRHINVNQELAFKGENIINRLLNIYHNYTTLTVKKISTEINEEITNLMSAALHKDKEEIVINEASKHFNKILELKLTYSAMYLNIITRDELKKLFRSCYYYSIYKHNSFIEIPEDLIDIIEYSRSYNLLGIAKLNIKSDLDIDRDEHLKVLFITSILEIPVVQFVLDSAVDSVVDKDNKINIDEFKEKTWNGVKSLLEFLNSDNCNKLYKASYSVDIHNTSRVFESILKDDYNNHKDWFHKLLKKYNIFKINKKYIAV